MANEDNTPKQEPTSGSGETKPTPPPLPPAWDNITKNIEITDNDRGYGDKSGDIRSYPKSPNSEGDRKK